MPSPPRPTARTRSTTSSTSYEGWAKYNRHYWLRDYRGFLEFFFGEIFPEPHSTKQIEDGVAWGLDTTPETLIATTTATTAGSRDRDAAEALLPRVALPGRGRPRHATTTIVAVRARRAASPS